MTPHFRVLSMEDAIIAGKNGDDLLVNEALKHSHIPKNKQTEKKGGAVAYGMANAVGEYSNPSLLHRIAYTDFDLSVDTGQLGSFLFAIQRGSQAVAGSRRLPQSIYVTEYNDNDPLQAETRNSRANLARYLRLLILQGLLPIDTQCGIKAFTPEAIEAIIMQGEGLKLANMSFDIEWLARATSIFGIESVTADPVAWFDSVAFSSADDRVHLDMLRDQVQISSTETGKLDPEAYQLARDITSEFEGEGGQELWNKLVIKFASLDSNDPMKKYFATDLKILRVGQIPDPQFLVEYRELIDTLKNY